MRGELDDDALLALAAAVLRRAVEERDLEAPGLEFWCDVIGLEPALYFERARGVVNAKTSAD